MKNTYVGLDVHAQTISVAVAEGGRKGEVRSLGTIPNSPDAVARLMKKLGSPGCVSATRLGHAAMFCTGN
jgi:hypothetical protein